MESISSLIGRAESGDSLAAGVLFDALYSELRRLARRELGRAGAGAYLSATSLLHEAYLDMAERGGALFPDRARFLSYASRVMRGLVIDHARSQQAQRRGGQFEFTSGDAANLAGTADYGHLAQVSEALDELAKVDADLAEIVDLKFFCGFSFAEIAGIRGLSERTVQRRWEKARIYLHRSIRSDLA
jgi:RNA polymerase sigma factor (TIGR02999 family)